MWNDACPKVENKSFTIFKLIVVHTAHWCPLNNFHSLAGQKPQSPSDSTHSETHSPVVLNGEATTAELSAVSASEDQETHSSSDTEALAEPDTTPELDEALAELSLGKSLKFNIRSLESFWKIPAAFFFFFLLFGFLTLEQRPPGL